VGVMSAISVIGILVGVAALITVLGVMNGFDEDLKSRIIGMRAHLIVEKEGLFSDSADVIRRLTAMRGVRGAAPYIEGQALLQSGDWGSGVLVRGIDPRMERSVTRFFSYLTEGTLSSRKDGIVIGSELAKRAHLAVGSAVQLATQFTKKPVSLTVEGIFSSGMYDFDSNLVFLDLANAQVLYRMENSVSGVSVSWENADRALRGKRILQKEFGYPFYVRSWMDLNKSFFSALKLEKTVMFLILALIILVACLNIAGSLTILVVDKTKDIGVLKALGATSFDLVKIFAWDGLALGSLGAFAGLGIAMGLCFGLKRFSWFELPKEIYYIDRLPVLLSAPDVISVVAVAIFLSFVSALYPAWMAGRLDPAKALRYE
jgi:lipoprotein-releasing system permease protein